MHSWLMTIGLVLSCAVSACGGGAPPGADGGAGAGAFPPIDVKTVTLEAKPVPQSSEFWRRSGRCARRRSSRRSRDLSGRSSSAPATASTAGQPLVQIDPDRQQATVNATESQRAAREADLTLAKQQLARMQTAARGGRRQPCGARRRPRARTRTPRRSSPPSSRRFARTRCSCSTTASPRRRRNRRRHSGRGRAIASRRATVDHDDRSAGRTRGLRATCRSSGRRICKPGLTVELLDGDGNVIAVNPITFIAPRADDATQSVLVKATLPRRCRRDCA